MRTRNYVSYLTKNLKRQTSGKEGLDDIDVCAKKLKEILLETSKRTVVLLCTT